MKPDRVGLWRRIEPPVVPLQIVFRDSGGVLRFCPETAGRDLEYMMADGWELLDSTAVPEALHPQVVAMVYDATLFCLQHWLRDDVPDFVRTQIEAAHDCYRHVMGEEPMSIGAAAAKMPAPEPPSLDMGVQRGY